MAAAMLHAGFTIPQMFLAVAVLNAMVAAYIYTLVPEFLMRFLIWLLIHTIYRLEKTGLEKIPDEGAAVIVCNHVSFVDALIIAASRNRRIPTSQKQEIAADLAYKRAMLAEAASIKLSRRMFTCGPTHGDFSVRQLVCSADQIAVSGVALFSAYGLRRDATFQDLLGKPDHSPFAGKKIFIADVAAGDRETKDMLLPHAALHVCPLHPRPGSLAALPKVPTRVRAGEQLVDRGREAAAPVVALAVGAGHRERVGEELGELRARAEAEAHVEWIDGNIGSRLTMKYPSVYLMGPKASGEVLSVAYAGPGQIQDAGAKMVHCAPETTSTIVSKSISKDGGTTTYRGLVKVEEGATGAKSFVRCDALLLDETSISETKPYMEVGEQDASIGHEATVSKIGDDQLFYLMSRGLTESQAMGMIVNGFIEPVTRTLPMEYAVEWSRLIELQMEGSIG